MEASYWHACDAILRIINSSLEAWIGADQAAAPTELLAHARTALVSAVRVKVEAARADFEKRKKSDRDRALEEATPKTSTIIRSFLRSSTTTSGKGRALPA